MNFIQAQENYSLAIQCAISNLYCTMQEHYIAIGLVIFILVTIIFIILLSRKA